MFMIEQTGSGNCHSVCWQGPLELSQEIKTYASLQRVSEYAYCLCFVSKFRVVEHEFLKNGKKFIERSFKHFICSAATFPFRNHHSFAQRG